MFFNRVALGRSHVAFDVADGEPFVASYFIGTDASNGLPRASVARYGADGGGVVRETTWEGEAKAISAVGGSVFYYREDFACHQWSYWRGIVSCIKHDTELRRYLVETPIDHLADAAALRRLADTTFVMDLVSDGQEVIFATEGAVRRVRAGTGARYEGDAGVAVPEAPPSLELLSGLKGAIRLALDSDGIYVASEGTGNDPGSLVRIARNDGSVQELVSSGSPRSLALDAQHVYFVDGPSACGFVGRVPKRGGPIEFVAVDQPNVSSVAVDPNVVAWTRKLGSTFSARRDGSAGRGSGRRQVKSTRPCPRPASVAKRK